MKTPASSDAAAKEVARGLQSPWPDSVVTVFEEATSLSIPARLVRKCLEKPDRVVYRHKRFGIYEEMTWRQFRDNVEFVCLGLMELGFERGQRMAIMADPCIEWPIADVGGLSAGGIVYGIYPTSSLSELQYVMRQGGARFFVAENQEYVDKILQVADSLPDLSQIIVADTRAIWAYDDPRLTTFSKVLETGRARREREPQLFERLVAEIDPDEPAAIVYTSGTSGPPKGATLSHRAVCSFSCTWLPFPEFNAPGQRAVSALPLAHLLERSMTVVSPLLMDLVVYIGDSTETLHETLYEAAPTFYMTVPRYWEKFASQVVVAVETSTWFKRRTFGWAMKLGRRYIERLWEDRASTLLKTLYRIAWWVAFRPVLDKVGFSKLRGGVTAAAPIPPEIMTLWQIWGVNLREGYGQTEIGWVTLQFEPFPKPGNVGKPFPWMNVEFEEDGELMIESLAPFLGYWDDPSATESITRGSKVLTGDVGEVTPDGNLKIIDRKKDIVITSGGKNLSPLQIESALKGSPYISEAIVFADGKKYPVALIEIDFDTVSDWARANGVLYAGFSSLAAHAEVRELVDREVARANEELARVERVKRFRILMQEFDPESEGDPVTPTRKIRRQQMYERFMDEIEEMYRDEAEPSSIVLTGTVTAGDEVAG